MSTSFSQAVEALSAQAMNLIAATTGEVDALREELEQERRFRRHLEANAAARAHEVAAQQEEAHLVRKRLEAELAEAREGRRLAEAEVERCHEAVRQQLAIAEQEQEQRARLRLEQRLLGVRLAVLDLLEPQDDEGENADTAAELEGNDSRERPGHSERAARLSLRKVLMPRSASQGSQAVLT